MFLLTVFNSSSQVSDSFDKQSFFGGLATELEGQGRFKEAALAKLQEALAVRKNAVANASITNKFAMDKASDPVQKGAA